MSGVDWLVILLMAVGLVVFIGEPILRRGYPAPFEPESAQELEQLVLQKETLYMAIRDLDFDYHTEKVEGHDYTELRRSLEDEAIQVLRQLDATDPFAALDSELEEQIAALRQPHLEDPTGLAQDMCRGCGATLRGDENFPLNVHVNFCAFCGEARSSA
ncbi:MAG: hypothetical protein V3U27_05810 [Candidatus Tectomicrobia bacterium]